MTRSMSVDVSLSLFNFVAPVLREPIARASRLVDFPARATIFRQDDPSTAVYALVKGAVRLEVTASNGEAALTAIVPPAQWFGDVSASDGRPQGGSAVTAMASTCLELPRIAFEQLLTHEPQMAHQCLYWIGMKERLMRGYLADANTLPLEQRFAKRLVGLASAFGIRRHDGSVEIQIDLTQQDLGNLLGATRQRMNQIMIDWRQRGLLAPQHRRIVLLNLTAIRGIAGPLQPIVHELIDSSERLTPDLLAD